MSPPSNRDAQLAGIPKPFTALNNTRTLRSAQKTQKSLASAKTQFFTRLFWRRRTARVRDRGAALNPILHVAQEEHIKDAQPNTCTQGSGVGEAGTYAVAALAR